MAKKQTGTAAEEPLRRTCGAMAAHMMLLERFPSFRASQMRLEGATNKRRETGEDVAKAKIVTIKTVVNVVYNTDEQNISTTQINSQYHYPSVIQARDGAIHATYSYFTPEGKSIKHVRFDEAWVKEGDLK